MPGETALSGDPRAKCPQKLLSRRIPGHVGGGRLAVNVLAAHHRLRNHVPLSTPSHLPPDVLAYDEQGKEAGRLAASAPGRLEFLRIQELLRRWLPLPPTEVRDVGGGAGVHARWLGADGATTSR